MPPERDPLTEMLTENGIRSVTGARGGGLSVRFGSSTVKDLSDGQFPVEVFRCMKMGDGKLIEEHRRTVKLPHRLQRATNEAGRGWRHGAKEQWVEVRTPKNRQETRYEKLHQLTKPALRKMLLEHLRVFAPSDLRVFQLDHGGLLSHVLETLRERGEMTAEEVRSVYASAAREHGKVLTLGSGVPQDFGLFMRDVPAGPLVEIRTSQIGAIRQEEEGFLKGLMYICGVLFHVEFIRVKWKEVYTADGDSADGVVKKGDRLATFNEDGVGEQLPWNDQEDSLCQQWWYQSMVHVDECVFHTIEVPPFEGRYVVLIHPGGK